MTIELKECEKIRDRMFLRLHRSLKRGQGMKLTDMEVAYLAGLLSRHISDAILANGVEDQSK